MTIEEKAKAYDEAIERAQKLQETCDSNTVIGWMEYIFPKLKKEDEKIKREIIEYIKTRTYHKNWIAWLEKQGEHQKFRDSIQVGDRVTRNEDGVLVNLSQLNRIAKKEEPRSNQLTVEMEDVLNEYIDMQNNSKNPCKDYYHKVKNCQNFPCETKKTFDERKLQGKTALEAAKEEKVDNRNYVKPDDKVEPKRLAEFYIVAHSFDEAADEMKKRLDEADYGFSSYRTVPSIDDVAVQHFYNGKQLFSESNANLIIVED